MSNEKMGGPAFPVPNSANVNGQEGMTLWDYYAAAAVTGYLAAVNRVDDSMTHEAATAADLMIAERAKRMDAKS